MRTLTIAIVILVVMASSNSFAGSSHDATARRDAERAAEYYKKNAVITPEVFSKVERYVAKNFGREVNIRNNNVWSARSDGFVKGRVVMTWDGKIMLSDGKWIGDWKNL